MWQSDEEIHAYFLENEFEHEYFYDDEAACDRDDHWDNMDDYVDWDSHNADI